MCNIGLCLGGGQLAPADGPPHADKEDDECEKGEEEEEEEGGLEEEFRGLQ